ncbi:MAG: hypothetical protein RR846_05215 [Oscillospiraceae bacterium]
MIRIRNIIIYALTTALCLSGCSTILEHKNVTGFLSDEKLNNVNYSVVTQSMLFSTQYAVTPDGCYEVLECSDGTGNVLYTDFDSKSKHFLSADITSEHNNESDASWLNSVFGGTSIFVAGEKLYVLKRGKNKEDSSDKYRTYFTQMNFNGSEHKKLYIPANIVIDEGSVIVFDEKNFYFIGTEYDNSKEKVIGTRKLFSLDTVTGNIDTAMAMQKNNYTTLVGAYNDKFIFQIMKKDINSNVPIVEIVQTTIENNNIVIYQKNSPNESVIMSDYEMFAFNLENTILTIKNLKTGETSNTLITISNSDTEQCIVTLVGDFYNRHLLFNVEDLKNKTNDKYAFQVDGKTLQKLTLYNNEMFVGIYAETEKEFLVITEEYQVTYPALSPDQVTYFDENRYVYRLALIDKEDYFNNIPNYQFINDMVEYR